MISSQARRPVIVSRLVKSIFGARSAEFGTLATSNNLQHRISQSNVLPAHPTFQGGVVQQARYKSTLPTVEDEYDHFGPMGELFELKRGEPIETQNLVGKTGSIRRVFGPGANAQGLLTCGGEELARHASFDPDYSRARGWIQNRAIGPAVLSPVLISGLVGALVEAAFPQAIPVQYSMHQARPLIVGVEVCAKIEVVDVKHYTVDGKDVSSVERDFGSRQDGYEVTLKTEVIRVQDDAVISEGSHSVWVPGYISM